ncbi:Thiamine monophosphate synthase [uncultured Sphingopyxis sp.]|uniref:Thiamine monophosphate synthase n=1 Tax=uncultured Sphingopyxis sp. TaxID=310581 RepID=A0A1Y5Q1Z4_9SPHN|nr:thiamine phosphate synthase [uncultured Sphingopyxis sp.]SBV34825.1 Thiamine monophosphate synthase [uncultured Sphingopyxis sp.]
MRPRHPLPELWLFSDERARTGLVELAALLPPDSGIIFRHDGLAPGARWRLLRRLMRIARARGLVVLLAGSPDTARRWGADGVHLRQRDADRTKQAHRLGLLVTMPVHDAPEARRARQSGADAVFVSPLYPTRSHPGAPALGPAAWLRLARLAPAAPIALGGMTGARARRMKRASQIAHGWAAIDAWDEKAAKRRARQKRNAVPI